MFQILPKTNINFIGKRKYAFIFSAILMVIGIIAFVSILVGKANMGLDFSGGTMIQGSFEKHVTVGELRSALAASGHADAEIQELVGHIKANSFIIRVKASLSELGKVDSLLLESIAKAFPENPFHLDSSQEVGPAIGKLLRRQAQLAVLYSLLGILVYIWIRFDFRFAVAATVATFHDVLAVLGIMFLLQKEVTLLVITALLTLAGYSLTDTVVVYDRIRENLRMFRKKGDFEATINLSINEVLSRTIVTSLTVFITVLAIYIFGGNVVRDFALAMLMGVIVGTYSSIYVASPIIVEWENRSPKRFK